MRIRIAVEVEAEGSPVALRSLSTMRDRVRIGVEGLLEDWGLEPSDTRVRVEEVPTVVDGECAHCGGPIPPPPAGGGRSRRFCSDAHRVAAQRRRAQGLPEQLPRPAAARGRRSLANAADLAD